MINAIVVVLCFLLSAFFATICESLRNFLRSRLAYLCRVRGNETRFGLILRDDELALQVCELAKLTTLVTSLMLATDARNWPSEPASHRQFWFDLVTALVITWLAIRVIPWSISRVAAESVLYRCWPLIQILIPVVRPILVVARWIDTLMHRVAGRSDPTPENLETFAEEIQSVVDEGEREGILESHSGRMIQRVMELREDDVRSVMTPRTDMVAIQASCSLEEARRQLLEAGHSRIPVVDGSMDDIVGLLYARDLLECFVDGEGKSLRDIVRPPFYVPETTTINALLDRMKLERLHLAIVLDEYGGVTGLVTLEDILEEIVGDIADEFDERPEELFQVIDPHTLWVDARMHLDELNELFDLNLPDDKDFDTIGGFVFSELGRVPKQGEQLTWDQLRITVMEVTERKLVRLELYSTVPWPLEDLPASESPRP
ncbi:hemolysin family protein [Planctomicrobium sp. SH661]|uniref:hemolysin family protein n=1 Tax=Planctomicrobium sp. SH661 TaxID=3448124 RepID=UPI003F5CA64A